VKPTNVADQGRLDLTLRLRAWLTPLTSALPVPRRGCVIRFSAYATFHGFSPGAGSALALVRELTADAFVNVGAHRFRLRVEVGGIISDPGRDRIGTPGEIIAPHVVYFLIDGSGPHGKRLLIQSEAE
jgi:hypothetical protein